MCGRKVQQCCIKFTCNNIHFAKYEEMHEMKIIESEIFNSISL